MGDNHQHEFLRGKVSNQIIQYFRTRPENPVEVMITKPELTNLMSEINIVEQGSGSSSNSRYIIVEGRGSYEIQVGIKMQQGTKLRKTGIGGGIAGFFGGGGAGAGIGALIGIVGGPIGVGIGLAIGAGVGASIGAVTGAVGSGTVAAHTDIRAGYAQCKIRDILPGLGTKMSDDNDDYIKVKITY